MKLNWGHYIVIAFILFGAFLTYFMIKGARNQGDLVTEDYYNQEIKYQQRIDATQRAQSIGQIEVIRSADGICVKFPDEFDNSTTGDLHMYKPDNAKLDVVLPIALNDEKQQCVMGSTITPGLWSVKVSAIFGGQTYYWEESIFW